MIIVDENSLYGKINSVKEEILREKNLFNNNLSAETQSTIDNYIERLQRHLNILEALYESTNKMLDENEESQIGKSLKTTFFNSLMLKYPGDWEKISKIYNASYLNYKGNVIDENFEQLDRNYIKWFSEDLGILSDEKNIIKEIIKEEKAENKNIEAATMNPAYHKVMFVENAGVYNEFLAYAELGNTESEDKEIIPMQPMEPFQDVKEIEVGSPTKTQTEPPKMDDETMQSVNNELGNAESEGEEIIPMQPMEPFQDIKEIEVGSPTKQNDYIDGVDVEDTYDVYANPEKAEARGVRKLDEQQEIQVEFEKNVFEQLNTRQILNEWFNKTTSKNYIPTQYDNKEASVKQLGKRKISRRNAMHEKMLKQNAKNSRSNGRG